MTGFRKTCNGGAICSNEEHADVLYSCMKTLPILAIAAALAGCATAPDTTTTTTSTRSIHGNDTSGERRVYDRDDLDRSGRATPGGALEQIDPDVTVRHGGY
jgi:hypothetical protein